MRTLKIVSSTLLAALFVVGCSIYRDYQTPETDTDGLFRTDSLKTAADSLVQQADSLVQPDTNTIARLGWKEFFTDAALQQLISTALENNADLQIARQRVIEAQASLKAAKWAFFPSVSFNPSYNFNYSEPRYGGVGQSYSIPLNISWEADLTGKLLNRKRKAQAALEQSEVYVRSVQTEIVATVAQYYYTLLKLDAQLEVSRTTSESWAENVRIMKAMKEAGMTNEASVTQTEANACSIEASLFDLMYQVRECENALCVLVGTAPQSIARSSITAIVPPESLSCGVPAQLLSNRADVKQAELAMRQAYYDTAIAKAAFYPSINVTALLGWDKAITSPAGWLISLGAGLTQPLFARGSIKSGLTIAQAKQEEASIAFRQSLLQAGAEVSDALALCSSALGKTDVRIRQIEALENAEISTRELMRHSESTYLEVLTAQQSLLSAKLLQISDRYDLLRGTVSLYKALGGGSEE